MIVGSGGGSGGNEDGGDMIGGGVMKTSSAPHSPRDVTHRFPLY